MELVEVEYWVQHMDDGYLRCRSLRHAWAIDGYSAVDPPRTRRGMNQFIGRSMTCEHCTVVRTDVFGRRRSSSNIGTFKKLAARYQYPDGYTYSSKIILGDRPSMNTFDNEVFRRSLPAELR